MSALPKELVHYTSWDVLKSMVETRCLWATHIRFMNDDSEYHRAQEYLHHFIPELLQPWLEEKSKSNPRMANAIIQMGGIDAAIPRQVNGIVSSLYSVTGDEFYVASFCGLPIDDYVANNGLLSQWRAYGNQSGIAVYFDTKGIEDLFTRECRSFSYSRSFIDNVVYENDVQAIDKAMGPHAATLFKFLCNLLEVANEEQIDSGLADNALSAFIYLATFLKHRAFSEEREVRLVASRIFHDEEFVAAKQAAGGTILPEKPAHFRTRGNQPVPYIRLFDSLDTDLPITRVLVGPGNNKETVAGAMRKFLAKYKIPVIVSDIPLR